MSIKLSGIVALGGLLAMLVGTMPAAGAYFTFTYQGTVTAVQNNPLGVPIVKGDIVNGSFGYDTSVTGTGGTFVFSRKTGATQRHVFSMTVGSYNDGSFPPSDSRDSFVIQVNVVAPPMPNTNTLTLKTALRGKSNGGTATLILTDKTGTNLTNTNLATLPSALNMANFTVTLVYDPPNEEGKEFRIEADVYDIGPPLLSPADQSVLQNAP